MLKIELKFSVLHQIQKESSDIAGIQLTRVIGHSASQVVLANDGNAVLHCGLSAPREFAVSTALRSQIHNHGTRRHSSDHFLRYEHRRNLAGNYRSCDNHVTLSHSSSEQFALAAVKVLILLRAHTPGRPERRRLLLAVQRNVLQGGSVPALSRQTASHMRTPRHQVSVRLQWPGVRP